MFKNSFPPAQATPSGSHASDVSTNAGREKTEGNLRSPLPKAETTHYNILTSSLNLSRGSTEQRREPPRYSTKTSEEDRGQCHKKALQRPLLSLCKLPETRQGPKPGEQVITTKKKRPQHRWGYSQKTAETLQRSRDLSKHPNGYIGFERGDIGVAAFTILQWGKLADYLSGHECVWTSALCKRIETKTPCLGPVMERKGRVRERVELAAPNLRESIERATLGWAPVGADGRREAECGKG